MQERGGHWRWPAGSGAANGLMKRGMDVSVVHVAPWLMERQLDDVAARCCSSRWKSAGMKFLIGAQTAGWWAAKGKEAASRRCGSKDGSEVPADLVVMAVGIRPNTALAESMRLHVNRGIVVSDTMQTVTDARIYAVGECARRTAALPTAWWRRCSSRAGLAPTTWPEFGIGRYTGSLTSTKLKVTGIDLFSAGNFMGGEGTEEIVMSDPYAGGVYKKLVLKDDKLVGACLYGDTVDGSWYFKLLRDGRSVRDIRDR